MANSWPENRHYPTISHSSLHKFLACDRAYALQYHHSVIPDVAARFEHKRESKLQPLNCFPGSIFHETIQRALMTYRQTGSYPPDLFAIAREITRQYITFSKKWVADVEAHPILGGVHPYWPNHELAQPIESFYYDGDLPPSYRAKMKEKLIHWFEQFKILSPLLEFSSIKPSNWLFPSEVSVKVPWFVLDDEFAVYSNFDFLTRDDGKITIYDWKTGKREYGEETVAEQLTTYAQFAVQKWQIAPELISLYAVWVDDGSVQKVECDRWELERMQNLWRSHQRDWKNRLASANGNAEKLFELFPMTNNVRTCANCSFRSCAGRLRVGPIPTNTTDEIDFWDD
jgi:hypothetical protein